MSKGTSDHYQENHLEDIGWARMKSILDKEMPQKKRRFLWLPLYGGIAASMAIIGLATYILMSSGYEAASQLTVRQQTDEQIGSESQAGQEAISSQKETVVVNADSKPPVMQDLETSTRTVHQESGEENPQESSINAVIPASTRKSKVSSPEEIATASTPDVDHRKGESMDSKLMTDVTKEETRGDHITDSKLIDREQRTVTHVALLPHSSSVLAYDEDMSIRIYQDTFRSPARDLIKIKNRRFSIEVGASVLSDLPLRTLSWDGGLNLRYRFSSKIGISTGLFFWRMNSSRTFYTNQYTANAQADRANSDWFVDLNNSQVDTLQLAGSTDKLNYIRLPLKVQLYPENRLSPSIGVSRIWYVEGLQSAEEQFSVDFSSGIPTTGGSLSAVAPEIVRKNNWTVDLGVTYRITDHFLTDFSISRGLKSYVNYHIQGSDFSELHNHYRLSMFYRF